MEPIVSNLNTALEARQALFDADHRAAVRLFNGFLEGYPNLVVDLLACTLVLHCYANPTEISETATWTVIDTLRRRLPWVHTVILKARKSEDLTARRGTVLVGDLPDDRIREFGVWYAVNPLLNQDNSFYLDTREIRRWALDHLAGKEILNTFAYTGSLGVAAQAAGAKRVIQLDRNRNFLNLAKTSYTLNGFQIHKADFVCADFYPAISKMRRSGELFDCVFLDPPFFSVTERGAVDLVGQSWRVINKVRPLVRDGGWLVAVNNALFVSGVEFLKELEDLCAEGYMVIERIIPVPPDCAGYPHTVHLAPPADPSPFNHSTKIVIMKVKRKVLGAEGGSRVRMNRVSSK